MGDFLYNKPDGGQPETNVQFVDMGRTTWMKCAFREEQIGFPHKKRRCSGGWAAFLKPLFRFDLAGHTFVSSLTTFLLSFLHRRVTRCALLKPTVDPRSQSSVLCSQSVFLSTCLRPLQDYCSRFCPPSDGTDLGLRLKEVLFCLWC